MSHSTHITPTSYSQLAGIPNIGLSENLRAALASGREGDRDSGRGAGPPEQGRGS